MVINVEYQKIVKQLEEIALELGSIAISLTIAGYVIEGEKLIHMILELLNISNSLQ